MCVIIEKPPGRAVAPWLLRRCLEHNPDGWGLMWAEAGQVAVRKGFGLEALLAALAGREERALALHLRRRTHGEVRLEQCHPFPVLTSERDGIDLWMMHNGVIAIDRPRADRSDSWHFARHFLQPCLRRNPALRHEPAFQELLRQAVGASRLLLLDGKGRFDWVNRALGREVAGCWLSSDRALRTATPAPQKGVPEEFRHPGVHLRLSPQPANDEAAAARPQPWPFSSTSTKATSPGPSLTTLWETPAGRA